MKGEPAEANALLTTELPPSEFDTDEKAVCLLPVPKALENGLPLDTNPFGATGVGMGAKTTGLLVIGCLEPVFPSTTMFGASGTRERIVEVTAGRAGGAVGNVVTNGRGGAVIGR